MYNWSNTDETAMKKADPERYRLWRMVEIINTHSMSKFKLDREEVKKTWPKIKDQIEPYTRRALEFILWEKRYSLPISLPSWNKPGYLEK